MQETKFAHRDIKPANIICFSNHKYKLTDFGLCKFKDKATTDRFVPGTPAYMDPFLYSWD